MKTKSFNSIVVLLAIVAGSLSVNGQNDTTKLKMGGRNITIITSDKDDIAALQSSIDDYRMQADAKRLEMDKLRIEMDTLSAQSQSSAQNTIQDLERRIEAYERGIQSMEQEIEDLENGVAANNGNEDEDEENSWDHIRKFDPHWGGLEIGANNYLNNSYQLQLPAGADFMELNTGRSWAINLNLLEYGINIVPNALGLGTGLGFEWNNYHFQNDINLIRDASGVITSEEAGMILEKNTLNTVYMTVPLILEAQVPAGKKKFYVAAGATGSLKLGSKTKQDYKTIDGVKHNKIKDDYQLSPFRYGLTARIGYGPIRLFANYSLVSLFEKNKGPEVYPITVGIALLDF